MTLTRDELRGVLGELAEHVVDSVVQQVRVPDRETVALSLRRPGSTRWLLLSTAPRLGRLHLIEKPPPNPRESLVFQGLLRKELRGRVFALEHLPGERITRLRLSSAEATRSIVLELYGSGGNIVLLDEQDRVLGRGGSPRRPGCAASRGELWEPPGESRTWEAVVSSPGELGSTLEGKYAALAVRFDAELRTLEARRRLGRRRKELTRLARRQERDLARIGDAEVLRRTAELLQGSFHRLEKGSATATVVDWAADGQPEVQVEVDPALAPSQLVARAFARARKAERAAVEGQERLSASLSELAEVDELEAMLEDAPDDALELMGELTPSPRARTHAGRREGPRLPYVAWLAPSGHEIRAGRGARDNDELTLRHSKGNDVWLHVRGRPGTHVVIRSPGESPAPELLVLAAQVALVRSGLKDGAREEVTWTRIKHVSKPKGSKPGSVVARQDKVLYVEVDRAALEVLTRVST